MIRFDSEHKIQDFTFILSLRNHQHLGQLRNIDPDSVDCKINMNAANEISLTIYKYNNIEMANWNSNNSELNQGVQIEYEEPLWDEITDFKFIYVKELDEYFEITVEKSDEESLYKTITGTDASVVELSQTNIYNLEINSELDIAREDYVEPTRFYYPEKPECSLLHRALYKLPQYSITHVDASLATMQRTFSVNGTDVYSFLTGEVAEEFDCLFAFDSVNRTIAVYDLKTNCLNCGHRGDFNDVCPECGSTDLSYYGEDTTVYVDSENLAENITLTIDTESVKNCFKLSAGDDDMTAAVVNLNPNGSDYIYYFSADQKHDMPTELVEKIESYDVLLNSYNDEYTQSTEDMYEAIDKIIYYNSGMMPTQQDDPTNAQLEAAKLTQSELSPVGMTEVSAYTSTETVNTAMKNYAKVFVKSGYFKIEINQGVFDYEGIDADNLHYGYWKGNFKITNYSDEEDVAISPLVNIKVCDDFETYMVQKINKKLALEDNGKGSIFDVVSIKEEDPDKTPEENRAIELQRFKDAIKLYCLTRLKSFYDAIEACIDIMIEMDQGKENSDLYESLYQPYYDKLQACQLEIDARQASIDEWTATYDRVNNRRVEIQKILNFENYLGTDLYKVFCMYKREDQYSNDNYISDGLENDEIFERAKTFLETAKSELVKAGTYQHNISASLINLLSMKEFEPIQNKFKIGNFIRVNIDGSIYRLRLISYDLSFGNIQDLNVEFSDAIQTRTGITDIQSILSKAQSMASSYGGIMYQVKDSKKETDRMKNWIDSGLAATEVKIVNSASNQNIVMTETGLVARQKDDFEEKYSDCQVKLLSTGLYVTNNNWKSVVTGIGKYKYINPETQEEETAFGILGENIVGELIIGSQLRIYADNNELKLSFDDNGLVIDAKEVDGKYKKVFTVQKDGIDQMYIDANGNLVFANPQTIETTESIEVLRSSLNGAIASLNNINPRVTSLEENIEVSNNAITNIHNVMAGNVGIAPNNKFNLNANNTVIGDTLKIKASQVNYIKDDITETVQKVLEDYKTLLNSLQEQINNIDGSGGSGSGGTGGSGTSDYESLTNKPQINGVELTGNKTLEDLGITIGGATSAEEISYGEGTVKDALDNLQELITVDDIDTICTA